MNKKLKNLTIAVIAGALVCGGVHFAGKYLKNRNESVVKSSNLENKLNREENVGVECNENNKNNRYWDDREPDGVLTITPEVGNLISEKTEIEGLIRQNYNDPHIDDYRNRIKQINRILNKKIKEYKHSK